MDPYKIILLHIIFCGVVNSFVIKHPIKDFYNHTDDKIELDERPDNVFNGVYSECFLHLSYSCLQKKTLLYLKELNNLSEVSVIGDYVKFVKINTTTLSDADEANTSSTDELAFMIDKAVDDFFDNHVLKFNALGRDISIPRNIEEFVGRKKRKGGGGGGMMGHDDGGKKKIMMMAMMCMKMKLMMMVPAMMGMMGMMSFKGMMFSMMSFMLSKVMLLMKILEKKGGAGGLGGVGGGGDGGWAAGGAGGGAWMPAGGQDFGGGGSGGGGGGYDANGQWQSRSIVESLDNISKPTIYYTNYHRDNFEMQPEGSFRSSIDENKHHTDGKHFEIESLDFGNKPDISFVKPVVRFNNKIESKVFKKPVLVYKKSNVDFSNYEHEHENTIDVLNIKDRKYPQSRSKRSIDLNNKVRNEIIKTNESKSRKRRSILDLLQTSYMYWMNRILGSNNNRRTNIQKYKIVNGVRYVYYPFKAQRPKMPKEVQLPAVNEAEEQPIITAEDFNKGEIMEGAVESRMNKKKFHKMKNTVNDTMDDNPWE